jgi:hypothetical protein
MGRDDRWSCQVASGRRIVSAGTLRVTFSLAASGANPAWCDGTHGATAARMLDWCRRSEADTDVTSHGRDA